MLKCYFLESVEAGDDPCLFLGHWTDQSVRADWAFREGGGT